MNRQRRRASDVAGQMPAPKWAAMVMIVIALCLIFMVKCGAEEYTSDVMNQLVGDPELELPESYSDRLKQSDASVKTKIEEP